MDLTIKLNKKLFGEYFLSVGKCAGCQGGIPREQDTVSATNSQASDGRNGEELGWHLLSTY